MSAPPDEWILKRKHTMKPFSTVPENQAVFDTLTWKFPPSAKVIIGPPHDTEHGKPFRAIHKLSQEGQSVLAVLETGAAYVYFAQAPIWQAWVDSLSVPHTGEWFVENIRWNTSTAYAKPGPGMQRLRSLAYQPF